MVFHNRVFSSRRKIDLKKLAPYALHLVMVVAVAIYVFFGALAIRELEAIRVENVSLSRERRSASEEETERGGPEIHVKQEERLDIKGEWRYWKMSDSILVKNKPYHNLFHLQFCFTIATTIGYGNVAPKTTMGRLFVIFYGLVGVPFTMLAIANLGKFLAELLKSWTRPLIDCIRKFRRRLQPKTSSKEKERLVEENGDAIATNNNTKESIDEPSSPISKKSSEEEEEDTGPVETSAEALMLFSAFILYIVMGSVVIGLYEPEMDFFMAIYFNFVTLTTIGLGDLVPKSESYLLVTLVYCAVGLALTTIAIEIAADYLKKLHYFGRKIENVQNVQIWFGGKKLTMKQLVKNLGDQFNIPIEEMQDLNLDHFVDQAIKVEAGELPTLRAATPNLKTFWGAIDTASMAYADEDDLITIQSNRKGSSLFVPTLPPPALDG